MGSPFGRSHRFFSTLCREGFAPSSQRNYAKLTIVWEVTAWRQLSCYFKRLIPQASLGMFLLKHHASSPWWCYLPNNLKKLFKAAAYHGGTVAYHGGTAWRQLSCYFKRLIPQASLAMFLLKHHASSFWWCHLPNNLKKLFKATADLGEAVAYHGGTAACHGGTAAYLGVAVHLGVAAYLENVEWEGHKPIFWIYPVLGSR